MGFVLYNSVVMSKKIKKLGIIGGTFDPIHYGHIGCAEAAADAFDLDEVWFMPANHPNFKQDRDVNDIKDRLKMCELALAAHGNEKFKVSDLEANREGTTFTSETLEILKTDYPDTELFFITGTDAVFALPEWHNSEEILQLATIIAVTRKGYHEPNEEQEKFLTKYADKIKIVEADVIDVSSSQIRQRLWNRLDVSDYVPSSIFNYMHNNDLY